MKKSFYKTSQIPSGKSLPRTLRFKRKIQGPFLLFFSLICLLGLSQCSKSTAKTKANDFLQAYYVEVNLQKALDLCHGLATFKIKQELDLGGGIAQSADMRQRKFTFKLLNTQKEGSDRIHFTYKYDIDFPQKPKMQGKIRLSLAQFEKKPFWKIVNFVDIQS
jgi:hypothetical protein